MKKKNIFLAKYIVVAMMMGIISPHFDIQYTNDKPQVSVSLLSQADAREKRVKRKRPQTRPKPSHTRPVHHKPRPPHARPPHHKPRPPHARPPHYRPKPNNYYYRSHRHRDYGYYRNRRIVAFASGLVIGSIVASSSMPTTCTTIRVNGISYRRCDNMYYRPAYNGDMLVYEAVRAPY